MARPTLDDPKRLSLARLARTFVMLCLRDETSDVSLAALAKELGVARQSVWAHVRTRDWPRAIGEAVVGRLHVPERRGPWRRRLLLLAEDLATGLAAMPDLLPYVGATATASPAFRPLVLRVEALLDRLGTSDEKRAPATHAILRLAVAHASARIDVLDRRAWDYDDLSLGALLSAVHDERWHASPESLEAQVALVLQAACPVPPRTDLGATARASSRTRPGQRRKRAHRRASGS